MPANLQSMASGDLTITLCRVGSFRAGRHGASMIRLAAVLLLLVLAELSPAHAQRICPDPFNSAPCTPITASTTGNTSAITATLPAVAGKTTYICGFYFTGTNATAANTATMVTITGTIGGTMNFGFPTLAGGATIPNTLPLDEEF